jgi:hypothetical protein
MLTLAPLDLLFLVALAALHLLLLIALATLGPLHIALALTLYLLGPLTLRTLDGAPLYPRLTAFYPGLAPFHPRSGSLGDCTRGLAAGASFAPTSAPRFVVLRPGKAGSAGSEQQYPSRCRDQFPVHLDALLVTPSATAALRCSPRISMEQRVQSDSVPIRN